MRTEEWYKRQRATVDSSSAGLTLPFIYTPKLPVELPISTTNKTLRLSTTLNSNPQLNFYLPHKSEMAKISFTNFAVVLLLASGAVVSAAPCGRGGSHHSAGASRSLATGETDLETRFFGPLLRIIPKVVKTVTRGAGAVQQDRQQPRSLEDAEELEARFWSHRQIGVNGGPPPQFGANHPRSVEDADELEVRSWRLNRGLVNGGITGQHRRSVEDLEDLKARSIFTKRLTFLRRLRKMKIGAGGRGRASNKLRSQQARAYIDDEIMDVFEREPSWDELD
ncbi:hypothetical protein FA15DRAFT_707759 [Coprinopsis marcescibilis]|uniref:Uncharacterized protein n=1 Tax=Coprinopsis marcescibilis TaxID=230819 RepID=A0A5C3KKN6_COPMA|nr:hypothetical protein FA15DRAFT_707759 [Coprinopsis marcescibilis]